MDDLMIIELYFARNEQAINETDIKYGKLCLNMANNILSDNEDSKECVNDIVVKIVIVRGLKIMEIALDTLIFQRTHGKKC